MFSLPLLLILCGVFQQEVASLGDPTGAWWVCWPGYALRQLAGPRSWGPEMVLWKNRVLC